MARPSYSLARGLGWFSIGLGLAEVLAPGKLARALGMRGEENLLRLYGLREIAAGVGLLGTNEPRAWLWGRVAGDALDLATLAARLNRALPREQRNIAIAIGAVAGVTVVDAACALARQPARRGLFRDYSDRSGFPRPPGEMRGVARDFIVPRDMRTPVMPPTFH